MDREKFLEATIEKQVEYVNSRTITGDRVIDIAKDLGLGDRTITKRFSKEGYKYNRTNKLYELLEGGNNKGITGNNKEPLENNEAISNKEGITKEVLEGNNGVITEETSRGIQIEGFSIKDVEAIKELLEVKDQLVELIGVTQEKGIIGNNKGITIFDTLNLDKSNRKKATFNMDLDLLDILNIYEKEATISKSDVVNVALMEYFRVRGITKE